jgi:hypothetical protein
MVQRAPSGYSFTPFCLGKESWIVQSVGPPFSVPRRPGSRCGRGSKVPPFSLTPNDNGHDTMGFRHNKTVLFVRRRARFRFAFHKRIVCCCFPLRVAAAATAPTTRITIIRPEDNLSWMVENNERRQRHGSRRRSVSTLLIVPVFASKEDVKKFSFRRVVGLVGRPMIIQQHPRPKIVDRLRPRKQCGRQMKNDHSRRSCCSSPITLNNGTVCVSNDDDDDDDGTGPSVLFSKTTFLTHGIPIPIRRWNTHDFLRSAILPAAAVPNHKILDALE